MRVDVGHGLAYWSVLAGPLLVQTTTADHLAARRCKVQASAAARLWLRAGGRIELHGWELRAGRLSCRRVALTGADDVRIGTNLVSGGPPFASIIVRKGELVFLVGIPAGKQAHDQLLKLATIALKRF